MSNYFNNWAINFFISTKAATFARIFQIRRLQSNSTRKQDPQNPIKNAFSFVISLADRFSSSTSDTKIYELNTTVFIPYWDIPATFRQAIDLSFSSNHKKRQN